MYNNSLVPNRKNLRIKGYDYSTENLYFITICTENRKYILGNVIKEQDIPQIQLTTFGKIVEEIYRKTLSRYNMKSHNYIIMPNHIHAMIEICKWAGTRPAPTICDAVRDIKSLTTIEYIKGVKQNQFRRFNKRIWQRNYYEHIIRNEKEYYQVFQYVENNPYNWEKDYLNCYSTLERSKNGNH